MPSCAASIGSAEPAWVKIRATRLRSPVQLPMLAFTPRQPLAGSRVPRGSVRRPLGMTFDAPTAQLLSALFSAMQQRRWCDRIDELIAETERTGKVPHVVFSVRHDYVRVFDANAGRPRSEP